MNGRMRLRNLQLRYILLSLLTATVLTASMGLRAENARAADRVIVFTHVNVITMESDKVLADQSVIVDNGKIRQWRVHRSGSAPPGEGGRRFGQDS